jgi:hypothetical protein
MQKHVEKTHPFYAKETFLSFYAKTCGKNTSLLCKRKFSIPSFSVQCSHVKSRDKYSMKEEKIEILG